MRSLPAAGALAHEPRANWEHAGTAPFTFVDSVEEAIDAAQRYAGDRVVDVAGGEIGGQAPRLGSAAGRTRPDPRRVSRREQS
ncbi:hypothetical protein GCM10010251_67440 [Streptomyces aurantiogriseus]|uniref:Uncharacterized protein n=1 Tax=Streptomyces aurantiogriseus TaxID=66870 RepID=A0A918FIZ0_9ACTN|nr:hypothetical protein GCM10010251_67440 [Streptomyces aurantiogriseus]